MRLVSAFPFASACLMGIGCETQQRTQAAPTAYPKSVAADSMLGAASAIYDDGQYDSAESILRLASSRAAADGDSLTFAKAETKRGLAQYHLGKYAEARRTGEAALQLKIRLGMKQELFKSYNGLGLLAYDVGRYGDASELFTSARAVADSLNDSVNVAKAVGNLGMVHTDIGRFEDAKR